MTDEEEKKLSSLLTRRYKELAFNSPQETWRQYLERNGMQKSSYWKETSIAAGNHPKMEIVRDPSPFGGFILVPEELATKILVLGMP
jgi:hypothetical protein